jgi:molybdopterin converting factor subunit 1
MPRMRIDVLCFAMVREVVGQPNVRLELADGATPETVAAALVAMHPGLRPLLPTVRYAVNEEFAAPTCPLRDGDRVALVPPVSGG